MIETKSTWPYIDLFKQYKGNINTFVETGTCSGDSVQDAIKLGFTKILSVEINPDYFSNCCIKFEQEIESGLVKLFLGDSIQTFPLMLQQINESAMFWLDAHQDANITVNQELLYLTQHPIKNNVIIIDDIPLYFDEQGIKNLQYTLNIINQNFKFAFNPMHGHERYQMVAYE